MSTSPMKQIMMFDFGTFKFFLANCVLDAHGHTYIFLCLMSSLKVTYNVFKNLKKTKRYCDGDFKSS